MSDDLSDIQPFEGLTEALDFFSGRKVYSDYRFTIREVKSDEPVCPGEVPVYLPQINITRQSDDTYIILIFLDMCHMTPFGETVIDCILKSRFAPLFKPYAHFGWQMPVAEIKGTVDYAARFVTYYMRLLGYASPADYTVSKEASLSKELSEIPEIDRSVIIPGALRRAVHKLKELGMPVYSLVILEMYSDKSEDPLVLWPKFDGDEFSVYSYFQITEEEFERKTHYQFFHNIDFSYVADSFMESFDHKSTDTEALMRFLTDFFLFNNPGVSSDEVSVDLTFGSDEDELSDDPHDFRYTFFPDGSESPAKQLDKYLAEARKKTDEIKRLERKLLAHNYED